MDSTSQNFQGLQNLHWTLLQQNVQGLQNQHLIATYAPRLIKVWAPIENLWSSLHYQADNQGQQSWRIFKVYKISRLAGSFYHSLVTTFIIITLSIIMKDYICVNMKKNNTVGNRQLKLFTRNLCYFHGLDEQSILFSLGKIQCQQFTAEQGLCCSPTEFSSSTQSSRWGTCFSLPKNTVSDLITALCA